MSDNEKERAVEEALAAADAYAVVNQHGGDAGHLLALAEAYREATKPAKKASPSKK